jgi:hypothetical protein
MDNEENPDWSDELDEFMEKFIKPFLRENLKSEEGLDFEPTDDMINDILGDEVEISLFHIDGEMGDRLNRMMEADVDKNVILDMLQKSVQNNEKEEVLKRKVGKYDVEVFNLNEKKYNDEDTSNVKPLSIEDLEERFLNEPGT